MRWRRGSRGQSMVEFAIVAPVIITLFLGAWTAADLIADNNVVLQAARAGARYAAELGNNGYSTGDPTSPVTVDTMIIDQMTPIMSGKLTNATLTEIDIYQPDSCNGSGSFSGSCPPDDGSYQSGELVDVYKLVSGTWTAQSYTYLLSSRSQVHPNESELGVRIQFTYTSPTLRFFSQTDSQYAVVRLAPEE